MLKSPSSHHVGSNQLHFGKRKDFPIGKRIKKKNSRPHIVVGKRLSKVNATILTNLFPTGLTQFKVMGQCFNVMTQ